MNPLKFFALVGIFYALLQPLPTQAEKCNQLSEAQDNYVVIGAFKYHRNAIRFTSRASRDLGLPAKYEMNIGRNLYYVYVMNTPDREAAIAEAIRLRNDSEFRDTWVYNGTLGKIKAGSQPYAGVDINPETNVAIKEVSSETANEELPTGSVPVVALNLSEASASAEPVAVASKQVYEPDTEISGKEFNFHIVRNIDNKVVEGDVDVIDMDKLKKIGSYKGNTNVRVSKPSGKSGMVSLVCEVFGYRKVQKDVAYANPEGEGIQVAEGGAVVVPFELMRLQKGDIAIMYNVYFFKDAAVMRPESRYEVNSLLEMLKENTKYKIKIHGHTNGKASGKIVMLQEGNQNPFSLSNTKDAFGSAKKLSEERAKTIRDFLVSNGVEESRMHVKAWGGKRPIHDKHSTRAQENVRVEIEILED